MYYANTLSQLTSTLLSGLNYHVLKGAIRGIVAEVHWQ